MTLTTWRFYWEIFRLQITNTSWKQHLPRQAALNDGVFPDDWKKGNTVIVYKRNLKNMLKNYGPISLLAPNICKDTWKDNIYVNVWVLYWKWIFHSLSVWFSSRWLLHFTTLKYNNESPPIDVRGVFLDTSKAFDKIWHKVVVCKRKSYRISSNLLKLIDRKQRVLINGQTFSWRRFLSGVLQRLVLGPLLFLIYINNFPDRIQSICKVFVF